jgi:phosphohistidine phosphatase
MKLYLVRHAAAVEKSPATEDSLRFLTPGGRSFFGKTARRLRTKRISPDIILTSPHVRAVQTAEILAAALGYAGELIADRRLVSLDLHSLDAIFREHPAARRIVMVGHNPSIAETAAAVLGIEPFRFPKGAALALSLSAGDRAEFLWLAAGNDIRESPEELR